MRILVARVGKGRNRWADLASADYLGRLRQLKVEEVLLKPAVYRGDEDAVRAEEGQRILELLRPGDRLVAMDERGELPTSEEFAGWLDTAAQASTSRLVFAIGGPYGHDPQVRAQAWRVLAVGRWVTNHELARVILAEQLYRASTLLWGGSYHH